jgi:DNA-directed RNA polymerase specialized sigma24 family protein
MRCSISQDDLRTILYEADVAARRLLRQLGLSRSDLDDLRQDFLVDLIGRLPAFDPDRGTLGAFAGAVMANRATRLAQKVKRQRQLYGAMPISLDEHIPDSDGATRGDVIPEGDGLSAYFGQHVDAFAEVERRIDVERGLGGLDPNDAKLAAALSHGTVDELSDRGPASRSGLYRRVRTIRLALLAAGLKAA